MKKISTRILLPAISATLLFSIVLYFVAVSIVDNMVEDNLHQIARSKFGDITSSEKTHCRQDARSGGSVQSGKSRPERL